MSNEDPPILTADELSALWAEIGREAVMVEAMRRAHREKVHRYEHELDRAHASDVRQFRPRPSGDHPDADRPPLGWLGEPPFEDGPDEHGYGDPDLSSL